MKQTLEVNGLRKEFDLARKRKLTAVAGVSFSIGAGEAVGLIGESGSGKTTVARCLAGLTPISDGEVSWKTEEAHRVGMVFQDPQESMNPKFSLWESIGDPLAASRRVSRAEAGGEIRRAAEIVGLDDESLARMPGECSAEVVQRASIARALVVRPHLLILDEPTTSLDADARSAVLELIHDLRGRGDTSVLLVTHDLSAVRTVTDSLYIMYLGSVMEQGPTQRLFERPLHPYTRALLGSHLEPDPALPPKPMELRGEIPDPADRPPGCPLAPRCPWATEESIAAVPELGEIEGGHRVACVRAREFAASDSVPHASPTATKEKGALLDE